MFGCLGEGDGGMLCERIKLGVVMWGNRSLFVVQFYFVLRTCRCVSIFWHSIIFC